MLILFKSKTQGNGRKGGRSHKKPPNPGPVVQMAGNDDWPVYMGENPITSLKEGRFHKVPVILGVTRDESASAVLSKSH